MRLRHASTQVPRSAGYPLAAGERVLATAATPEGWDVVATSRGLQYRDGDAGELVDYASMLDVRWASDTGRLDILVAGPDGRPGHQLSLELSEPGQLPATVRERVQASIVVTRRVQVRDHGQCTVAIRRDPDGHGPLFVQMTYAPGTDPTDPELSAQVAEAVEALSAQLG